MSKYDPGKDFPTDLFELGQLMAHWGHEMTEGYDSEEKRGEPIDRDDLVALLFVHSVINIATTTPPLVFSRRVIDREKRRKLEDPDYWVDPKDKIVEEMLDAGITAEKISKLVTDERAECARQILYLLCDPKNELQGSLGESLNLGLFLKDSEGNAVPGSDAAFALLHTRFYEARPDLDPYYADSST